MFTLINYLGDVARVIFRVAWSAPHEHSSAVTCCERTQQFSPGMSASIGLLDSLAKALCAYDRALDVFIRMPEPAHPAYPRRLVDNCQARDEEHVRYVRAYVSRSEQNRPHDLVAGGRVWRWEDAAGLHAEAMKETEEKSQPKWPKGGAK
jgi:hypothetical protein